jgi:hypothetical protein
MKIQGDCTCNSLLATQNAHHNQESMSHPGRLFYGGACLSWMDAISLTFGLIVDCSCDFCCGFCDLKELSARQVNDTIRVIHRLNVSDMRGTHKRCGRQLDYGFHGRYSIPVVTTLGRAFAQKSAGENAGIMP